MWSLLLCMDDRYYVFPEEKFTLFKNYLSALLKCVLSALCVFRVFRSNSDVYLICIFQNLEQRSRFSRDSGELIWWNMYHCIATNSPLEEP